MSDNDHKLQCLTFDLGSESYGIDILRVREIRGWSHVRELPNLPPYIKGVIDFRGGIVPIVDLRIRFGREQVTYEKQTVVIIVTVHVDSGEVEMGMVVDAVSEVVDVDPTQIRPKPALGSRLDTRFLKGVVNHQGRMIVLIDLDKLLNPEDFDWLDSVEETP